MILSFEAEGLELLRLQGPKPETLSPLADPGPEPIAFDSATLKPKP